MAYWHGNLFTWDSEWYNTDLNKVFHLQDQSRIYSISPLQNCVKIGMSCLNKRPIWYVACATTRAIRYSMNTVQVDRTTCTCNQQQLKIIIFSYIIGATSEVFTVLALVCPWSCAPILAFNAAGGNWFLVGNTWIRRVCSSIHHQIPILEDTTVLGNTWSYKRTQSSSFAVQKSALLYYLIHYF